LFDLIYGFVLVVEVNDRRYRCGTLTSIIPGLRLLAEFSQSFYLLI